MNVSKRGTVGIMLEPQTPESTIKRGEQATADDPFRENNSNKNNQAGMLVKMAIKGSV